MKAIVQDRYGPPEDVLELREIDTPVVGADEVLVRVGATCVHPDVWHAVTGRPYILRLMGAGVSRPRDRVPGMDVAGRLEAVGEDVTRFEPGDEVFGATRSELQWRNGGAFAEYVAVPEQALAPKPEGVTFEQAAAVPISGYIAVLNLSGGEWIEPGQRVLVNGAGGAVGSIAMQLARERGAHVTGVDGTAKLELMRSFGADRVIDYTQEDLTRRTERYDVIFDVASNLSLRTCSRLLEPGGIHVLIGHDHFGAATGRLFGSVPRVLAYYALSPFVSQLKNPKPQAPVPTIGESMVLLERLLGAGKLTVIIDRTYPLADAPQAMRYLQEGQARGRIVITPRR